MRMGAGVGGLGRAGSRKLLIKVWPLFNLFFLLEHNRAFHVYDKIYQEKRAKTTYSTWKIMIRILSVSGIEGGLGLSL